jgi:hypothetical protein
MKIMARASCIRDHSAPPGWAITLTHGPAQVHT